MAERVGLLGFQIDLSHPLHQPEEIYKGQFKKSTWGINSPGMSEGCEDASYVHRSHPPLSDRKLGPHDPTVG